MRTKLVPSLDRRVSIKPEPAHTAKPAHPDRVIEHMDDDEFLKTAARVMERDREVLEALAR